MASHLLRFESARDIETHRELKRRAQNELLDQAKAEYECKLKRKQLKEERGENKWMLPTVVERLDEMAQEHGSKPKKKSKKEKKKKKKKAVLKDQVKGSASSSHSSSDSSEEWVEAPTPSSMVDTGALEAENAVQSSPSTSEPVKRDEWMNLDFLITKSVSLVDIRAEKQKARDEERQKKDILDQPGVHERELNPYWKSGGTGLPPEQAEASTGNSRVGDCGVSWLHRSYQRMKERAQKEGRHLDSIIEEQYGSREKFEEMLGQALETLPDKHHRDHSRSWRKPHVDDMAGEKNDDGYRRRGARGPTNEWHNQQREKDQSRTFGDRSSREGERNGNEGWRRGWRKPGNERSDCKAALKERDNIKCRDPPKIRNSANHWIKPSSLQKCGFLKPSDDDYDFGIGTKEKPSLVSAKPKSGFLQPQQDDDTKARAEASCESELPITACLEKDATKVDPLPKCAPMRPDTKELEEQNISSNAMERQLTEDEMNRLGAKLVKAELLGNQELAESLKQQLDAARKIRQQAPPPRVMKTSSEGQDQEILLVRTDRAGHVWPIEGHSADAEQRGSRKAKVKTHVDGERIRYFDDDDKYSLQDLVRREHMSTAEDQNNAFAHLFTKVREHTDGEHYTLDDMFVSAAGSAGRSADEEMQQRRRAAAEQRKLAGLMANCGLCFDSPELRKHLVVAVGSKVFMSLPNHRPLVEGHCIIAPLQHYTAGNALDEDVWAEMQTFRKALVQMFSQDNKDCVFLEICTNSKRRYHMMYECVPLDHDLGNVAPMYFKKAILESDEEWSMNKKLVDLSQQDIRRAVPKGLPYFSVDFGLQGGFAHVIEDKQKFPHYFGKEVLGGMLDAEPRLWRKPPREGFEEQRRKVLRFAQMWKPFDFTRSKC
uniref:CWF19-like protein 2 n=1 Tax=Myxine glutinosa TaxID=7769 RepID=UPI00358E5BB6